MQEVRWARGASWRMRGPRCKAGSAQNNKLIFSNIRVLYITCVRAKIGARSTWRKAVDVEFGIYYARAYARKKKALGYTCAHEE
jgi:hypothetical protein